MNKVLFLGCGIIRSDSYNLNNQLMMLLREALDKTLAKVVVSSVMRANLTHTQYITLDDLYPRDFTTPPFPAEHFGEEIDSWLLNHPMVSKWAIVDDSSYALLPYQRKFFVKANEQKGINQHVADQLIRLLS